ncbi:MAG TPA: NAD(P)H-dependent oxidoreductase [Rhizomicrobium sp.]|nr:NAD(P)H-dependent oxidoreductase [Rhizomicrobium sp.]
MKHILLINGNPDPSPEKLTSALAKAYREGAEEAGCRVRQIDVGGIEFPWLQNAKDFATKATDKTIVEAQSAIRAADHIVFIYPLWLGSAPALLKAYMERIACGEFLLGKSDGGFPPGQLKGRSARVIVTMGMPSLLYRIIFGAHGVKAFNHGILGIAGIKPVKTTLFGGSQIQPQRCARAIEIVREMGRSKS